MGAGWWLGAGIATIMPDRDDVPEPWWRPYLMVALAAVVLGLGVVVYALQYREEIVSILTAGSR